MEGVNFVALNIQTANHSSTSICAIGLAKFINGKIVDRYTTLVNPEEEFDGFYQSMHKITSDLVKEKPLYSNITKDVITFIDGLPVVSHYAPFSFGAIQNCNKKYDISDFYIEYFCSCALTKALHSSIDYGLRSLCKEFNIDLTEYNALSHAEASGKIIMELIYKNSATDLSDLYKKANYKKLGMVRGFERIPFEKSQYFSSKEHVNLVDSLDPSYFNEEHPFYRKHAVITGKLNIGSRNHAFELFEKAGGIREEQITKLTNFLIMGEQKKNKKGSNKITDVQKRLADGQEIEILIEEDFLRML
ncbi:hypothetical protein [Trichococcus alkaliphilus]|uniref:hypothetical protein n=1 Tax=Trichococcus alkaliphilus TaxID=2052943 RepID=UPI000D0B4379|nr:hypothetical protein [Trichococcus alkaliphilus]